MAYFKINVTCFFIKTTIVALAISSTSCRSNRVDSDVQASITDVSGDKREVNLSTFVARRGECEDQGNEGYELALNNNMRYSEASFSKVGNTLIKKFDPAAKDLKPLNEIVNSFEQGLLIAYSGALYRTLNSWLRNKKMSEAFYRDYTPAKLSRLSMCLASAINRLANYQGVNEELEAYRGAFLDRTAVERYKKGAILPEVGFQSYSFNKNVALSFSGAGKADDPTRQSVLFVVKSTKPFGANLEGISSFSDEESEILFSTDHNYCVDNVTDQTLSKITNNQAGGDASVRVIQLVLGAESCGI